MAQTFNVSELAAFAKARHQMATSKANAIRCTEEQAEALLASPHECVKAEGQLKLRSLTWDREYLVGLEREAALIDWAVAQLSDASAQDEAA